MFICLMTNGFFVTFYAVIEFTPQWGEFDHNKDKSDLPTDYQLTQLFNTDTNLSFPWCAQ
jgi:hypothetical protein